MQVINVAPRAFEEVMIEAKFGQWVEYRRNPNGDWERESSYGWMPVGELTKVGLEALYQEWRKRNA